jgi:transposase
MFSYVSSEQRVRADHPLRAIRAMTDRVFAELSPRFTKMYSDIGRPSIPPEQLLRALLLQSLYTVRSERLLMEAIDYSVLYRWFVGLSMDDPIWSPTTFSKNRDRLLDGDIAGAFFDAVLRQAADAGLLSDEHFTVDGTLLEAWASLKRFRRRDADPPPPPDDPRNPTVNFHGESHKNDTHQSTPIRTPDGAQGPGEKRRAAPLCWPSAARHSLRPRACQKTIQRAFCVNTRVERGVGYAIDSFVSPHLTRPVSASRYVDC